MESTFLHNIHPLQKLEDLKEEYKFNKSTNSKINNLLNTYSHIRKVRGDGNCYYRSVMFRILEKIIYAGTEEIQAFINLISKNFSFFEYPSTNIVNILKEKLAIIKSLRESEGKFSALWHHYDFILKDNSYDLAYITLLRLTVSNLLRMNSDLDFNGITLNQAVGSMESFIRRVVLPNSELVQSAVLNVVPIILRIQTNITVLSFDSEDTISEELFSSMIRGINVEYDDCLNWHNDRINLLFLPGHYNILYTSQEIEDSPELLYYDVPDLKCEICRKPEKKNLRLDFHGHIAHYQCFLTKLKEKLHECPICKSLFSFREIQEFLAEKDYQQIVEYFQVDDNIGEFPVDKGLLENMKKNLNFDDSSLRRTDSTNRKFQFGNKEAVFASKKSYFANEVPMSKPIISEEKKYKDESLPHPPEIDPLEAHPLEIHHSIVKEKPVSCLQWGYCSKGCLGCCVTKCVCCGCSCISDTTEASNN